MAGGASVVVVPVLLLLLLLVLFREVLCRFLRDGRCSSGAASAGSSARACKAERQSPVSESGPWRSEDGVVCVQTTMVWRMQTMVYPLYETMDAIHFTISRSRVYSIRSHEKNSSSKRTEAKAAQPHRVHRQPTALSNKQSARTQSQKLLFLPSQKDTPCISTH